MPMDGRPAATWAIWPDIEKLICAKLDSFSNPESAVEINSSVIPGPRFLLHGPIHPRQPPCPRFPVERYRLAAADEGVALQDSVRRDRELSSGGVTGRTHEEVMQSARRAIKCG